VVDGPEPLRACSTLPRGEPRTARGERSPLLAREKSVGREMAGYFGLVGHDFHENRKGSLTCRKYTTRDPQLYFPSEGRHSQDFLRPEKIRRLRPGLNPRSWVPEASMLTTRVVLVTQHPKGMWNIIMCYILKATIFFLRYLRNKRRDFRIKKLLNIKRVF
jgi:hypothetical protein